jgi:hypothetical protein
LGNPAEETFCRPNQKLLSSYLYYLYYAETWGGVLSVLFRNLNSHTTYFKLQVALAIRPCPRHAKERFWVQSTHGLTINEHSSGHGF